MVDVNVKTTYSCSLCGEEYFVIEEAENCESQGFSPEFSQGQIVEIVSSPRGDEWLALGCGLVRLDSYNEFEYGVMGIKVEPKKHVPHYDIKLVLNESTLNKIIGLYKGMFGEKASGEGLVNYIMAFKAEFLLPENCLSLIADREDAELQLTHENLLVDRISIGDILKSK